MLLVFPRKKIEQLNGASNATNYHRDELPDRRFRRLAMSGRVATEKM